MLTRRHALLSASALIPLAVAGCSLFTETTTNGVTTITVNVAQISAWGQAFANGAALIAALPVVAPTPTGLAILALSKGISADLAAFSAAAGGSLTLSFNSTSVPAAVSSLLTDGKTLLTDAGEALGSVAASVVSTAQTYITAIETIVSLLEVAVGSMAAAATLNAPKMSESDALKTLGVPAAH